MAACNEDCDACSAYAGESFSSPLDHGKFTTILSGDIEDVPAPCTSVSLCSHDLTLPRLKTIASQLLSKALKRTPEFVEMVDSLRDAVLLPASFFCSSVFI